jgi:hypothetical protein
MNFRVTINGTDISDIALIEGLEINRRTDEAISTARVQIQQRLNPGSKFSARAILEQQEIIISEDTIVDFARFAGYISEITRTGQDNEKYLLDIRAVDYGIITERKVSALVFTDATDRAIAQALAAEAGLGSADSTVDFTNILAEFDARDLTTREALERLAEITGCRWHVDPAKTLWYFKPGVRFASFNLSDTPDYLLSFPYQMTSFNREFSSAANRMLLLGGADASTGGELRVTRDDAASIATYGVIEAVKVDRSITAASVGQLLLDAELAERSTPRISGRALIRDRHWQLLQLSYSIGVKSALYGIDDTYQIFGQRMFLDRMRLQEEGDGQRHPEVICEIEFGVRESDFVSMIRRLARQDTALPEAIIGPDTVIPAENITGVIAAEHIGGVAAEDINGQIIATQIGSVSAETITGVIGGPGSTATVHGQSITGVIGGPGSDVDITAGNITGVIVGAQLTDQILDTLRLVGSDMGVVERVSSTASALPALPNLEYPIGGVVLWEFVLGVSKLGQGRLGSVLYENISNTWQVTSASATLTGIIKAADIDTINARQITGVIVASQIDTINADQIVGIIQADNIGMITADQIISVNSTAITGPISATNITSLNAANITMIVVWDKDQIGSVKASSITAGTISATVTMTSPDIRVTGTGYNLVLNNTVGLQITATSATRVVTLTNAQIRYDAIAGDYTQIWEYGLETAYPDGGKVQCGAFAGQSVVNVFNTASGASCQMNAFPTGVATFSMSGPSGATMNIGGAILTTSIASTQYRVANAGALTIVLNASKSMNIYDTSGALLGRIPIY